MICSGSTERQVDGIYKNIVKKVGEAGQYPEHTEGDKHCKWVLIDYGDFVVHVFREEERSYYDIERLWGDAERIDFFGNKEKIVDEI